MKNKAQIDTEVKNDITINKGKIMRSISQEKYDQIQEILTFRVSYALFRRSCSCPGVNVELVGD